MNWANWLYVYVNNCLAFTYYDANLYTPGYMKFVGTWNSFRIPDLTAVKAYHQFPAEKTALAGLEEIVGKIYQDKRYVFYLNSTGQLRLSSYPDRGILATENLQATIIEGGNVDTPRYSVNQLVPQGNYYAMRFNARELDRLGRRRYRRLDYTEVASNSEAYAAGARAIRQARELGRTYSTKFIVARYDLEREDALTIVNTLDGTNATYRVNDIQFDGALGRADMTVGWRKYIS